jgi:hypothetical protein
MCSSPRDRVTFILFILRDATVTRQQLDAPSSNIMDIEKTVLLRRIPP